MQKQLPKQTIEPSPRRQSKKLGISIISCNFINLREIKNSANGIVSAHVNANSNNSNNNGNYGNNKMRNKENVYRNQFRQRGRDHCKPLRSLSAERIKRKKQKIQQKKGSNREGIEGFEALQELREQMQGNINMLQMQYDQLKLKRSMMTQRQSQKSTGKARISDAQSRTEPKAVPLDPSSSSSLITKCVPKSKINLNLFAQPSSQTSPSPSPHSNKENSTFVQNLEKPLKQRQYSHVQSSSSNFQQMISRCHLSESICSSSLSNLQVIPIGLNVSIAMNNRSQISGHGKSANKFDLGCVLSKSYFRRKGIKVVSSQKYQCASLDNSVVSLEVVRQVSRGKLLTKTQQNSIIKQPRMESQIFRLSQKL